jgi:hypothetical protein
VIDVLGPVPAAAHGGCVECDPNDDRGDDLYVFQLGGSKIRLCRPHLTMLQAGIARAGVRKLDDEHRKANQPNYLAIVEQAERDRENSGN